MPHNLIWNHVVLILEELIHRDSSSSACLRFVFSFIFFPESVSSSLVHLGAVLYSWLIYCPYMTSQKQIWESFASCWLSGNWHSPSARPTRSPHITAVVSWGGKLVCLVTGKPHSPCLLYQVCVVMNVLDLTSSKADLLSHQNRLFLGPSIPKMMKNCVLSESGSLLLIGIN